MVLDRLVRHARISNKQNAAGSIRPYDGLNTGRPGGVTAEFLLPGKLGLVANTNVQGETRRDLQFILEEGLVLPEKREAIRRAEPETHVVEGAEHEICHGRPRTGPREGCAACAVPSDQIEVDVHPLVSPLEGV